MSLLGQWHAPCLIAFRGQWGPDSSVGQNVGPLSWQEVASKLTVTDIEAGPLLSCRATGDLQVKYENVQMTLGPDTMRQEPRKGVVKGDRSSLPSFGATQRPSFLQRKGVPPCSRHFRAPQRAGAGLGCSVSLDSLKEMLSSHVSSPDGGGFSIQRPHEQNGWPVPAGW